MQVETGSREKLFAGGGSKGVVAAATSPHVDAEPFDFLIQRRKRNQETLSRFRLIPPRALEHIHDDAPLDCVHDLEQRRLRMIRRGAGTWFAGKRRHEFG